MDQVQSMFHQLECLDVAYKTETEAKVVPHICPKIEDSELVIDEDFGPFDSYGFILSIDCPH